MTEHVRHQLGGRCGGPGHCLECGLEAFEDLQKEREKHRETLARLVADKRMFEGIIHNLERRNHVLDRKISNVGSEMRDRAALVCDARAQAHLADAARLWQVSRARAIELEMRAEELDIAARAIRTLELEVKAQAS